MGLLHLRGHGLEQLLRATDTGRHCRVGAWACCGFPEAVPQPAGSATGGHCGCGCHPLPPLRAAISSRFKSLLYTAGRDVRGLSSAGFAGLHLGRRVPAGDRGSGPTRAERYGGKAIDHVAKGALGDLRRVVVHDGHEGPKEIGVPPEFLKWLEDPEQNGDGALYDFGCYGADLVTWLMHGESPISVTAVTQTDKPQIYPRVADEATIIMRYPKAQAVLMASWNWPFSRKDMEVYGAIGYAITVGPDKVRLRAKGQPQENEVTAPPLAPPNDGSLHYLAAVLKGTLKPDGDLTSLDTNVVVMQILDTARQSAREGRTIKLTPLPR